VIQNIAKKKRKIEFFFYFLFYQRKSQKIKKKREKVKPGTSDWIVFILIKVFKLNF